MEQEIQDVESNVRVTSTERSLRLMSHLSWFLNVGIAHPRSCPKAATIILRIVHLVAYSIFVVNDVINFFTSASISKLDTFTFMYYTNKIICYVAAYYYIYHGIDQYSKWPELMNRMNELDQIIKNERTSDQPVKNMQAILATFLCGPFFLIVHALYYYVARSENVFMSDFLFYYTTAQSLINSFVFNVVVYILYHRFQTLNGLIRQLNKLFDARLIAYKIRRIRESHIDIYELMIMVNNIYGSYLLFCSVNCFTMITTTLFKIYIDIVKENYTFMLINNILWILYAAQFGLMCWICTLARQEFDETGIIIHTIELKCNPANLDELNGVRNQSNVEGRDSVRREVNDFSIQLGRCQIALTACNFFEMNNTLFIEFIGVIATYLIVFIQFYQSEKSDA